MHIEVAAIAMVSFSGAAIAPNPMFVIHIKETEVAAIAMVSFSGAAIAP